VEEKTLQEVEEKLFVNHLSKILSQKTKKSRGPWKSCHLQIQNLKLQIFFVLKRRNKDPKTTTKSDSKTDSQVETIQEESSKEKDS